MPETTEKYHRIPVAECEVTATIDISEEQGIKALYCGKEEKVRTYLFDTESWTMAEAKAWVKEHEEAKAVGEGRGAGGDRQGEGAGEGAPRECVCPKCGYEMEHERNVPCTEIKCPKCGAMMVGKRESPGGDPGGREEKPGHGCQVLGRDRGRLPRRRLWHGVGV